MENKKIKKQKLKLLKIKNFLNNLFNRKKEILQLKVRAGTQKFYVRNPKKIIGYIKLAQDKTERSLLSKVNISKQNLVILKVWYKNE